jgi:hypothetical protein
MVKCFDGFRKTSNKEKSPVKYWAFFVTEVSNDYGIDSSGQTSTTPLCYCAWRLSDLLDRILYILGVDQSEARDRQV